MKILVACEESGVVTKALRAKGHEAWSCDILPTRGNPAWHLQDDVAVTLDHGWDMMIAFPPCTFLTVTANKWYKPEFKHRFPTRAQDREDAVKFFMMLVNAPIDKIAIENPVGIMSTRYRKPDQIVQPYQFGHPETKKTCLWLKGLPKLIPTKIVEPIFYYANGKKYSPTHYNSTASISRRGDSSTLTDKCPVAGPKRSKLRSTTYQGFADAMAEQWT